VVKNSLLLGVSLGVHVQPLNSLVLNANPLSLNEEESSLVSKTAMKQENDQTYVLIRSLHSGTKLQQMVRNDEDSLW